MGCFHFAAAAERIVGFSRDPDRELKIHEAFGQTVAEFRTFPDKLCIVIQDIYGSFCKICDDIIAKPRSLKLCDAV